jgi:hypothetical protein
MHLICIATFVAYLLYKNRQENLAGERFLVPKATVERIYFRYIFKYNVNKNVRDITRRADIFIPLYVHPFMSSCCSNADV